MQVDFAILRRQNCGQKFGEAWAKTVIFAVGTVQREDTAGGVLANSYTFSG